MKAQIPNAITSANLLCGCLALMQIAEGNLVNASLFVLAGAFFDFFDGMAARLLKVKSEIGAQLDSLADLVTFGVVPSFIAFKLIDLRTDEPSLSYLALLIAVFSALRLAKFNIDDRQTEQFIGLPTPSNALFWISIPLMNWQVESLKSLLAVDKIVAVFQNEFFIIAAVLILSYALVAEIPLLSLKFKNLSWQTNKSRFILLVSALILIVLFYFVAIPIILLLYLLISIIDNRKATNEI
jgi:CDP-diacylglycerol--serine O-phosphatidyltransferase